MDIKNLINKLKLFIPLILVAGIVLTSCDIDESLNNSPNAINEDNIVSVEGLNGVFIGMQVGAFDWYQRDRSRVTSVWTWQLCGVPGIARGQFLAYNGYQMNRDGVTDDFFLMAYRTNKLCNDLIKYVPDVNFADPNEPVQNTMIGIARTYKALLFGELAAFYGSIPINIVGLDPTPFVDQQTAYAEVQNQLDQAAALFANSGEVARDVNFGGDGVSWTKVVHSLKARYYLHMKDYQNALTHANQGIDSPDGTLYAMFSDQAGEYSAWGMFKLDEGEPLRAEKNYIALLMREEGDNRLTEYFEPGPAAEGEFYGYAIQNELNTVEQEENPDAIARRIKYATYAENFPIISHEETILIRAEAKAQTGDISGAVADVNIIRNAAGLPNYEGTDKMEVIHEILTQKHLELFLEGQTWHDIRRIGYFPLAVEMPGSFVGWNYAFDGTKTNLRWIYPQSELNTNPMNVPDDSDQLVKWLLAPAWGGM
jgi:tetratricopeptide (TPR) repeat protein